MSFVRNANPDATTSELDAKKIVNEVELTDAQRDDITQQFVEIVVDGTDIRDLVAYAVDQLISYHNEGSLDELREEVNTFDENLFDELVDNVTQQYAKLPNTFGEQS